MTACRLVSLTAALGASLALLGCGPPPAAIPAAGHPGTAPADGATALDEAADAADVPGGADAVTLDSKVTAVTVYSDRARVTRRAAVEVGTEPTIFAFRRLPGWVDDGSVTVSASAGRISDVRVERSFLARATDPDWQRAEAEHRELAARLAALADELAILDAQKAQIEAIKAFSLDKISKDTTIGDVSVQSYSDVLSFIGDALRKVAAERRDALRRQEEVTPEYQASARRLEELQGLMKLEETTVLVVLQAARPAQGTVELTYMMPGATWEPMHELRAGTDQPGSVEVTSFAVVTQTSGEDWEQAELSFSTQSTVEPVRIPELEALTLGDTSSATRVLTRRLTSFSRAQQAFEGQSRLWNKVHQKAFRKSENVDFERIYEDNMEVLQVVQSKTVHLFETLRSRGTTAHFQAAAAHPVRGDGHPARLRIGRGTLESTQRIVAVPEQSLNAARTLSLVNTTGQPLLPGKVALFRDGAFLGMTDVEFIAKGEGFSMFLCVADHLKLSRTLDRKRSSLDRKRRNRMRVSFVVTVENLSGEATELTLADRIPVSEDREIRVGGVEIAPAVEPDTQGILRWDLKLAPGESRQLRIGYEVEYPPELVLDAQRRRAAAPAATDPAAPASAGKYEIQDQLADLEQML